MKHIVVEPIEDHPVIVVNLDNFETICGPFVEGRIRPMEREKRTQLEILVSFEFNGTTSKRNVLVHKEVNIYEGINKSNAQISIYNEYIKSRVEKLRKAYSDDFLLFVESQDNNKITTYPIEVSLH